MSDDLSVTQRALSEVGLLHGNYYPNYKTDTTATTTTLSARLAANRTTDAYKMQDISTPLNQTNDWIPVSNESEMQTFNLSVISDTTISPLSSNGVFEFPLPAKVVIICFLSLIILCAIVGNALVCVAIFTERSLRKTSNFFYVSLALADLLVAMVVMTFALTNDMMGHWIFGPVWCDIWLSSDVMCSTASILNMCAICLDRFLHIKNPYHYDSTMTVRRTLLFIAVIWLLSGLISFLPIHLDLHKTDHHDPYVGDTFICLLELNPIYAVCSSLISFFVPCLIMIGIYVTLYRFARRHVKEIKRTSTWSAQSSAMLDPQVQQQNSYKASDHKAAITLGVIMGTFLFCWMPFFTMNITGAFCGCVPPLLFNALTWLGYINSVANPIIYPVFNKEFRVAFRRILSCFACDKNSPSCLCHFCRGIKKDVNKNSRSPSNSSNLFNKVQCKITHLNGHSTSFGTDATVVSDKSDYTIASQKSTSKSDSIAKTEEVIDSAHPLISSPISPQHRALDKVTVL